MRRHTPSGREEPRGAVHGGAAMSNFRRLHFNSGYRFYYCDQLNNQSRAAEYDAARATIDNERSGL